MKRIEIEIEPITINERRISSIIVDPHVKKHHEVNEILILNIVRAMDRKDWIAMDSNDHFQYFVSYLCYERNWYKMVWCFEKNYHYIGIITLFRDRRIKYGNAVEKRTR